LPLGIGSWNDPGPGFFPFWSGLLIGGLCLGMYLKAVRTQSPHPGSWYVREKGKKLMLILMVLLIYALILERLGFVGSTFLLLFLLFRWVEGQGWVWAAGGSLGVALVSYGVFDRWLMMQLPKGIWGF
jgi:putative tricarboxylic transport membrane protein